MIRHQSAFCLLLFCLAWSAGYSQSKNTSETTATQAPKFDPKRDAKKDIKNAVVLAQKTGKRILLDVGGEWCVWCHRLDKFFEDNKDAADYLHEKYIVVKVNYSPENKNEKLLSKYPKIEGYPHLFVLDQDGKLLRSQDTGQLEAGKGYSRSKVFKFLKKWAK